MVSLGCPVLVINVYVKYICVYICVFKIYMCIFVFEIYIFEIYISSEAVLFTKKECFFLYQFLSQPIHDPEQLRCSQLILF